MKHLLLTVTLCGLLAVLQAQDDLPFLSEEKNVSGTWYMKAIVNDLNTTEKKHFKKAFPFEVRILEKGKMEVMVVSMHDESCVHITFLLEKTEMPGQYSAFWGSQLLYIYELPVMDHYIFYSECKLIDQKFSMGELLGKDPNEDHLALEIFKKFTQKKGFPQENIIMPEQDENCVPEDHKAAPPKCTS